MLPVPDQDAFMKYIILNSYRITPKVTSAVMLHRHKRHTNIIIIIIYYKIPQPKIPNAECNVTLGC